MAYFRNILIVICVSLLVAVSLMISMASWRVRQNRLFTDTLEEVKRLSREKAAAEEKVRKREADSEPLRRFARAWEPFRQPVATKDMGNHLRNELSTLATRTGLTSEGATVPGEPRTYAVGGGAIKVQQISINVASESLPALLTWLGEVEGKFAYARVESLTLSSYASHSVQLGVTLLQPVDEDERFGLKARPDFVAKK